MREFRFEGKGLSIIQPWASATAFAGKNIENRTCRTHYRGPIAIHASGKLDVIALDRPQRTAGGGKRRSLMSVINKGRRRYGLASEAAPETGQIVAIAMLVDCVESSSSPWWSGGPKGWLIAGVLPIEPIPRKGGLGLWKCRFTYRPLVRL